jgi:hypothetical protein
MSMMDLLKQQVMMRHKNLNEHEQGSDQSDDSD